MNDDSYNNSLQHIKCYLHYKGHHDMTFHHHTIQTNSINNVITPQTVALSILWHVIIQLLFQIHQPHEEVFGSSESSSVTIEGFESVDLE